MRHLPNMLHCRRHKSSITSYIRLTNTFSFLAYLKLRLPRKPASGKPRTNQLDRGQWDPSSLEPNIGALLLLSWGQAHYPHEFKIILEVLGMEYQNAWNGLSTTDSLTNRVWFPWFRCIGHMIWSVVSNQRATLAESEGSKEMLAMSSKTRSSKK
jgi:hypothetical protein